MGRILFANARIVDANTDKTSDVLCENGTVVQTGEGLDREGAQVVDLAGLVLTPGFVDMHAHLRTPGNPEKETLDSGLMAALKGGYTTVCGMANTKPVMDSAEMIARNAEAANTMNLAGYIQVSALGMGLQDSKPVDYAAISRITRVFSNDGNTVASEAFMTAALEASAAHDFIICTHCHPESSVIKRDLSLLKSTGGNLHICHVSEKDSVEAIMRAKDVGVGFTAEATPHHLFAEELDYAVNPPFGSKDDRAALLKAVKDGYISILSTDHAPHTAQDKAQGSPGVDNLETAFGMFWQILKSEGLSLGELSKRASLNPSKRLGLNKGLVKAGYDADFAVINPDTPWVIDPEKFISRSSNTPFAGYPVTGEVIMSIVGGQIRYDNR